MGVSWIFSSTIFAQTFSKTKDMLADFIKKLQQKKKVSRPSKWVVPVNAGENKLLHKYEMLSKKVLELFSREKIFLEPNITLTRMSMMIGTNTTYLSNAINSIYGCNFNVFINRYRIEESRRLLKESSLSVKEIALKSGFASNSTFYAVFKKETDMSPTQYRILVRRNKIYEPI